MAGAAVAKARALAGHTVTAAAFGGNGERITVGRSRGGLGDKSRGCECSGGRGAIGSGREI